ncbi:hypothetical protein CCAX7_55200 [Capsulimonas corticalis]|uniref:Uncharacterized protein n=1 Tax=Capsulimonas corticalis TaxID=2219043 RepID=A0A402D5U2_9BACT|nr:helix-turn-helix transcriptional regulator [Capsulimonas corticalis]BDI33469.1 hypothetical protein CCAX7_55200 [Capsulimonas corticalis]
MIACLEIEIDFMSKENASTFSLWLAEQRRQYPEKLSQDDLADMANITQGYASALERGARAPSKKVVEKLARALAPPGSDVDFVQALIASGLDAAGFKVEQRIITRKRDAELDHLFEQLSGRQDKIPLAKNVLRAILESDSDTAIGHRSKFDDDFEDGTEGE